MPEQANSFEHLLEAVPDALVGMDRGGMIRFVNRQTESLFGYHRDQLIGRPIETLVPESLWQIYAEHREGYFAHPRTRSAGLDLELSGRQRDGTEFPIDISLSPVDTGDVLLAITAVGEMTEQEQAVRKFQLREANVGPTVPDDLVAMLDLLAQTIVQALGFGVAAVNIVRPGGSMEVISVAGDEAARKCLLGTVYSADAWDQILAMSEPWGRLRFADHRHESANPELLSWVPDVVPVEAPDAWHPQDALFAPLTAEDGSRLGVLSVDLPRGGRRPDAATCHALEAFAVSTALAIEHATLRSRAETSERSFRWLAKHDSLTRVGNRSMLFERLRHAATARPEHRSLMALAFIDLDGFKIINDLHSHEVGDRVLQAVAQRIRTGVRPHDTVIRWGGDEFLVLLEQVVDESAALDVARRILAKVAEPIRHLDQELGVTASLGIAFCRAADEVDAEELVRRADSAMYRAKRTGPGCWQVFDPVVDPVRDLPVAEAL